MEAIYNLYNLKQTQSVGGASVSLTFPRKNRLKLCFIYLFFSFFLTLALQHVSSYSLSQVEGGNER